jgi:hypothetical protein
MPLDALPTAHSPLGASGAERWMNCRGSTSLIQAVRRIADFAYVAEDNPDWQLDGVEAHAAAAYCLDNNIDAWRLIGHEQFPRMTPDMGMSVQVYLDYVRKVCGACNWSSIGCTGLPCTTLRMARSTSPVLCRASSASWTTSTALASM